MPGEGAQLHVACPLREVRDQLFSPMEMPVEDRDAQQSGTDQHSDHRPGPSTGTQDDRLSRPLGLHGGEQRHEPRAHAVDIGVVATQARSLLDDEVDCSGRPRVGRERIDQGRGALLVGSGDQRAGEVAAVEVLDGLRQLVRPALPDLDPDLQPEGLEGGPLYRLDGGMSEGLTDDGKALHGSLCCVKRGAVGLRFKGPMLSSAPLAERSHSGLVRRFAKPLKGVSSSEGSNPSLSAMALHTCP